MTWVFKLLGLVLLVFGVAAGRRWYWQNLRGLKPAIQSPSQNIAQVINTTGMPLNLPAGFALSIYAKNLVNVRVLAFDPQNNLLVSLPAQGKIVALPRADQVLTVVDKLNLPHGLAFRQGKLYIAESHRVSVFDYNQQTYQASNPQKILDLPNVGNHFSRTIIFTPNDKLLIAVGSSCNVCDEKDWRRAKILIANPDGSDFKILASGLRNSVFMTIHPQTQKTWATDMGRDLLGDDIPPDEINIIEPGKDYGWPYCYGKQSTDPFNRGQKDCLITESSYIDILAHSAPLGLAFIPTDSNWPKDYWHNLLVAYHGSWNRSVPTGYKIVRYKLDQAGNYLGEEDFITGWLTSTQEAVGRPVDILFKSDGTAFISDDKAGVIYKLSYTGN